MLHIGPNRHAELSALISTDSNAAALKRYRDEKAKDKLETKEVCSFGGIVLTYVRNPKKSDSSGVLGM